MTTSGIPYSALLGPTVDTRLASVYEAFGRISHYSTCSTQCTPSTSCVCHPGVALVCVWIWQTQSRAGSTVGIFVFKAPVAELIVVSFTVPLNGCTIAATAAVVSSCSSSADGPEICGPYAAAGVFASRCRVVVVFLS